MKILVDGKKGEAPTSVGQGTEAPDANLKRENPTQLMEEVCSRENSERAYRRVKSNKGGPGIDGMTVEELGPFLKENWARIRTELLEGRYHPQPVRRVEIPKPNGGVRKLGIPTVVDRLIQQALQQVLQRRWDESFSEGSYGFRPGRSAHQAVAKAQEHIRAGYRYVVDIDLEKFFDRVNHDKLMGALEKRITDKRVLKLIRAYLNAGVLEHGLVSPTVEGTPQGGPLSPLLSNIVLDELDKELERRKHRFVRYADDCNIYVKSCRAGERVMKSVSAFINRKLKLRVNESKSAVAGAWERKFLGFRYKNGGTAKRCISEEAVDRLKGKIRKLTQRTRGKSLAMVMEDLSSYLRGWLGYFGFCQTPSRLAELESWIRRRLRAFVWKQWKHGKRRYAKLRTYGISKDLAAQTAGSCHGPWRLSQSPALTMAMPNRFFQAHGLPRFVVQGTTG